MAIRGDREDKKRLVSAEVTLVAVDETGIDLQPRLHRTWGPRGERPVIRSTAERKRMHLISGISPDGRLWYQTQRSSFTGADCAGFLRGLLRKITGKIIVVWDRLPAHRSKEVKQVLIETERLELQMLPGYAPELNPDEWLNKYLKHDRIRNRRHEERWDLWYTLRTELEQLRRKPKKIQECFHAAGWI